MRFKVPFVGFHIGPTCIDGEPFGLTERGDQEDAHAHCKPKPGEHDPFKGFICARNLSALRDLMVHEIAHLAADAGHDDRWRKSVRRLGGRVPAAYRRKPRRRSK